MFLAAVATASGWAALPAHAASGLSIVTSSVPDPVAGQNYTTTLVAAGGTAPYQWNASGAAPAGLGLDSGTGVLSGMPVAAGTYAFVVGVSDSTQPTVLTATRTITITVDKGSAKTDSAADLGPAPAACTATVSENCSYDSRDGYLTFTPAVVKVGQTMTGSLIPPTQTGLSWSWPQLTGMAPVTCPPTTETCIYTAVSNTGMPGNRWQLGGLGGSSVQGGWSSAYPYAVYGGVVATATETSGVTGPAVGFSGGHSTGTNDGPHIGNHLLSALAATLPTPKQAFSSPSHDLENAAITLGLLLFITFPSNLFNNTFEENYDEIMDIVRRRFGWVSKLRPRLAAADPPAVTGATAAVPATAAAADSVTIESTTTTSAAPDDRTALGAAPKDRWRGSTAFWAVLLAGGVLGALLNPAFGVNGTSFLSLLATIAAILLGTYFAHRIAVYYRKQRDLPTEGKLYALPAGLIVALACVLLSRASGFRPGYLYGVLCGVSFSNKLSSKQDAHIVAISSYGLMAGGIVGWLVWTPLHTSASHSGAFVGTTLLEDVLASFFVSAIVGRVLSLLPVTFMPGHTLWTWNRKVWGLTFFVAVFLMMQVMLRPDLNKGGGHGGLATAIVLFVGFGGGSLLFREYFARRKRAAALVPPGRVGQVVPAGAAVGVVAVVGAVAVPTPEPPMPSAATAPLASTAPVTPEHAGAVAVAVAVADPLELVPVVTSAGAHRAPRTPRASTPRGAAEPSVPVVAAPRAAKSTTTTPRGTRAAARPAPSTTTKTVPGKTASPTAPAKAASRAGAQTPAKAPTKAATRRRAAKDTPDS